MTRKARFELGQVLLTPGVVELFGDDDIAATRIARGMLEKHQAGDWGAIPDEDKEANERALQHGSRLMSVYFYGATRVWVITEADRSVTTILLPEEY